jgi:hypothetical protein
MLITLPASQKSTLHFMELKGIFTSVHTVVPIVPYYLLVICSDVIKVSLQFRLPDLNFVHISEHSFSQPSHPLWYVVKSTNYEAPQHVIFFII